jgi:hypothetical protein
MQTVSSEAVVQIIKPIMYDKNPIMYLSTNRWMACMCDMYVLAMSHKAMESNDVHSCTCISARNLGKRLLAVVTCKLVYRGHTNCAGQNVAKYVLSHV